MFCVLMNYWGYKKYKLTDKRMRVARILLWEGHKFNYYWPRNNRILAYSEQLSSFEALQALGKNKKE